jgi:hypothetical protein
MRRLKNLLCRFLKHDWMTVTWYNGRPVRWMCHRCRQVKFLREE